MKLNIKIFPKADQEDLTTLLDLDRLAYEGEPPTVALDWIKKFPWMYTILKRQEDRGFRTMGYGLVIPIPDNILEGLRRGEIGEEDINTNQIRFPGEADAFYIASIATRPDITTYESSRLVGNVTGPILRSQTPVIAVVISNSGERIASEVGLIPKPYKKNNSFRGLSGYQPTVFEKEPFSFS